MVKLLLLGHSSLQMLRGGVFCICGAQGEQCVAGRRCLLSWRALVGSSHEARRAPSETIIHLTWRTGKERRQRTFYNVAISLLEVAALVREELARRAFAHTQDPGDYFLLL